MALVSNQQEGLVRLHMKYNTYIFDLDGTLLNTLNDLAASCNYALRTYGLPEHSVDDVRRFRGKRRAAAHDACYPRRRELSEV